MQYPTVGAKQMLKVLRDFLKEKPVQIGDIDKSPPTPDAWLTTIAIRHLGSMGKANTTSTRESEQLARYAGMARLTSLLLFGLFKEEGRYVHPTPLAVRIVNEGVTADIIDEMIKNAYPDCIFDAEYKTDILVGKNWPRYLAASCVAAYLRDVQFGQSLLNKVTTESVTALAALKKLKKQEEEIAAMKATMAAFAEKHLGTKESALAVLREVGIIREDGSPEEAYGGDPSP